ncbi:MAG: lipopolysaccharide kinase InaA family protein [Pseudomonadales bacterium]|nr:lipopolysaccharide kinase InaA family protein [Pseudomonadales bacterium]
MSNTQLKQLVSFSRAVQGFDGKLPFHLSVTIDGKNQVLECLEIYRLLAGRRIVCRAKLNGIIVLAKIFLGKKHQRYWQRELAGVDILKQSGVRTPRLLHAESSGEQEFCFLIFEFVEQLADEFAVSPERKILLLADTLADLHNKGIEQIDLHIDNFLFSKSGVWVIDGAAIRKRGHLSIDRSVKNLAELIAQLNADSEHVTQNCLEKYSKLRNIPVDISSKVLSKQVLELRQKRLKKLLEKTQRNCTAFYSTSDFRHFFVCERAAFNAEMEDLVADLDGWVGRGEQIKIGGTCTVTRVKIKARQYVIKRYNIKSRSHALSRALRSTRARRSWLSSHMLQFYGIPTAKTVALFEERWGFIRGRAFLIMEYLEGDLLSEAEQPFSREINSQIFSMFRQLKDAHLVHGDTKASNFILVTEGASKQLKVIDLDSLKRVGVNFESEFNKDIQRFLKNFQTDMVLAEGLTPAALSVTPTNDPV